MKYMISVFAQQMARRHRENSPSDSLWNSPHAGQPLHIPVTTLTVREEGTVH